MSAEGTLIGGKYRLDSLLGEGGMGAVWRATHLELDAPVAIKLVHAGGRHPERATARFLREAKAAAGVRHRNVVSITDFGMMDDGRPFMVMELLEGKSLAARMEQGPPMPVSELVEVLASCLSGLAAVHQAGLVHRDLKPENIFLVEDADGLFPKLLDFGVSRAVAGSGGERKGAMTTSEGHFVGTPHYMSPEQARGLTDIDRRSDLYAVGVILYEAIAGKMPYDSPHIGDLIIAITNGGAPTVAELRPDIAPEISYVIEKAMARDREERFATAREMRAALVGAARIAFSGFPSRISSGDLGAVLPVDRRVRESMDTLDPDDVPSTRPSDRPLRSRVGVPAMGTPQSRVSAPPVETDRDARFRTHPSLRPSARRRRWPLVAGIGALLLATGGLATWAAMPSPHPASGAAPSPPAAAVPAAPAAPTHAPAAPTAPSVVEQVDPSLAGSALVAPANATLDAGVRAHGGTQPTGRHHHHHGDELAPTTGAPTTGPAATAPPSSGVFRDPGF